jgi:hypothetical protein
MSKHQYRQNGKQKDENGKTKAPVSLMTVSLILQAKKFQLFHLQKHPHHTTMQNQTQNKISQNDSFPARISEANYRKKVPPDYKQNPRPVHPQKTRYPIKSNSQNTKKKKKSEGKRR